MVAVGLGECMKLGETENVGVVLGERVGVMELETDCDTPARHRASRRVTAHATWLARSMLIALEGEGGGKGRRITRGGASHERERRTSGEEELCVSVAVFVSSRTQTPTEPIVYDNS